MSQTSNVGGGPGGNVGANLGGLGSILGQWTQAPQIVGTEQPEWDFPYGKDRVADDVIGAFFRGDAGPTGLNEYLQQIATKDPGVYDRFRSYVNMGLIRPKNQAAANMVAGYGGLRAGDQSILGPMIDGKPAGLDPQYWAQYNNLVNNAIQYQLGLLKETGYFNNVPTMDREQMEQQLAQGWKDRALQEFQNLEVQRHDQATEGLSQQEINNQNIQKMSELFGGQAVTDPATGQTTFKPTEQARQFNTTQSGFLDGQATLAREQQAFQQAKDVAALASNPRNYLEAQMLGNARGGLGGMAPNNQIQQTTFGPPTSTSQMPQFQAPGGQYNQLQTLQTMQGQPQAQGGPAGGQAGTFAATPTAQAASRPPFSQTLANPQAWQNWTNAANTQWQAARQGMAGLPGSTGWEGLLPQGQTYPGPGPQPYRWGTPGGQDGIGAQAFRPGQLAAWQDGQATQPQYAVGAFSTALQRNRAVPGSGAMQTQGSYQTQDQLRATNPMQWRTQDFLRGNTSERQQALGTASAAGFSDEDTQDLLKGGLPSFKAPTAGKMI